MLIVVYLQTGEPVALTDEPSVFCRLTGQLPLVGIKVCGIAAERSEEWPNGAWLLEIKPEEMAQLQALTAKSTRQDPKWSGALIPEENAWKQVSFLEEPYLLGIADRFHGRPWKIAETERLYIREMCLEDAPALMEIYAEEQIRRFVEPLPDNPEEVRELIAAYQHYMYEMTGFGIWVVLEKKSGKVVGRVGFEPEAEGTGISLGYLLADFARGKGYGEEACRAALQYALDEMQVPEKEIRCHIAPDNAASIRLAKKLGVTICIEEPISLW